MARHCHGSPATKKRTVSNAFDGLSYRAKRPRQCSTEPRPASSARKQRAPEDLDSMQCERKTVRRESWSECRPRVATHALCELRRWSSHDPVAAGCVHTPNAQHTRPLQLAGGPWHPNRSAAATVRVPASVLTRPSHRLNTLDLKASFADTARAYSNASVPSSGWREMSRWRHAPRPQEIAGHTRSIPEAMNDLHSRSTRFRYQPI